MPVGPLRLQSINQEAVDREAQVQGAPTYSKLRRALLQTSTIAANEDNPAKKREMLRAAMEGTGTGFSDISLSSHNTALNKVAKDTDIANQASILNFQNEAATEAQERSITAQERMQSISLAEARNQAELNRNFQTGLAAFNVGAKEATAPASGEYTYKAIPSSEMGPSGFGYSIVKVPIESSKDTSNAQWKAAYNAALKNFYANR